MNISVIVKRMGIHDGSNKKMMDIADKIAIDQAVFIKERDEKTATKVSALCIAPPEDSEILRECFAFGADEGYLLNDPKFEKVGLEGLITVLYKAIKNIDSNGVVILTSSSNDPVTASLGKALADVLGYKHVYNVEKFEMHYRKLYVRRKGQSENEHIETPVVINFISDAEQKIDNAVRIMKVFKKEVKVLNARDLDFDPNKLVVDNVPLSIEPTPAKRVRH